jgi:hypothetical protein
MVPTYLHNLFDYKFETYEIWFSNQINLFDGTKI